MKRRTYNNVVKATKMIVKKGYSWNEANEIAMKVFDEAEQQKNGMSIEWYIAKIADIKREKKEWKHIIFPWAVYPNT